MAPELLSGGQPTKSSDVYAFGRLMHEVVLRREPTASEVEVRGVAAVSPSPAFIKLLPSLLPSCLCTESYCAYLGCGAQEITMEYAERRRRPSYRQAVVKASNLQHEDLDKVISVCCSQVSCCSMHCTVRGW